MSTNLRELLTKVVDKDYCIGCGVCASLPNSPLVMELDQNGKYRPLLVSNVESFNLNFDINNICPFTDISRNETEIGKQLFSVNDSIQFNEYIGYFLKNYAAYVKEGEFRAKGSSGGMGNWLATKLLELDLVDAIIHVSSPDNSLEKPGVLFEYKVSYSNDELSKGAKSKYYPIEMSKVINHVRKNNLRYAIIGIPCYIKSIRLLSGYDSIINDRIKYTIGLVCGHLKSEMFAKSIGWQLGIKPHELSEIDFRKKYENGLANRYGVEAKGYKGNEHVTIDSPTNSLFTTNWGHGFFKYNACEFCDDVLAETADITIGDAWLPDYVTDSMGTNIVVIRNPVFQSIIKNDRSELFLEEITPKQVYQSQASGLRHRREGLSYRLFLKDQKNEWRPNKRIKASNNLTRKRKKVYEKRNLLMKESFNAYKLAEKDDDFNTFTKYMEPIVNNYNKTVTITPSFAKRVAGKVKKEVKKLLE